MINLEPPELRADKYVHPNKDAKMLRLQNTGDVFFMDPDDWTKAKYCKWYWIMGRPMNNARIYFEDYVGIRGVRDVGHVEVNNFCRNAYILGPQI